MITLQGQSIILGRANEMDSDEQSILTGLVSSLLKDGVTITGKVAKAICDSVQR